ncbi:MAG: sulfatase [Acidobacteria bacterium]|nr:MAG: sulfatase [Acidobacteriota bacterium]
MRRFARLLRRGLGLLLALALAALAFQLLVPRPFDDRRATLRKEAYLARIAELAAGGGERPSFVLILFDDLGYGDLGCYGSLIRTPHLDALAAGGARLTQAYATSPYCSASRAGLLTGRYPLRAGLDHVVQAPWTWKDVLERAGGFNRRLPAEEITIAEILQAAGYATAIFGKWHLGDASPSLPNERGFDHFFGLLHSNDQGKPALRRDGEIVEPHPIDQATLSRRYAEEAAAFIASNRRRPFFLYLPHTFPHIPLHVPAARRGRSSAGLYGDVIEELDDSVGRVLEALRRSGREADALVLVSSDNGPWFQGSSRGHRGRKFDVFEGGMRVPFIASWPGRVAAGQVLDQPVMGIDVFPTLLELAGLPAPEDRLIDGRSLVTLLTGGEAGAPVHDRILYFQLAKLRALRQGRFKYHDAQYVLFGNPMGWPWAPMKKRGPWLFDLDSDPAETYDVSDRYPGVARRLRDLLLEERRAIDANPRGWRLSR